MSTDNYGGMTGVRKSNEGVLKDVAPGDLSGGVMPRDLFEDWYQRVQDTSQLLSMVRTEVLPRPKMELARIGVGERMARAAAAVRTEAGEDPADASPIGYGDATSGEARVPTTTLTTFVDAFREAL